MAASQIVFEFYMPLPAGAKYYTLKDDNVYYDCTAALSIALVDMSLYRAKLYRNELPIQYTGVITPFVGTADDRLAGTAPKDEQFKDTMMALMSAADGTGDCLAFFRLRDFDGFHKSTPVRY